MSEGDETTSRMAEPADEPETGPGGGDAMPHSPTRAGFHRMWHNAGRNQESDFLLAERKAKFDFEMNAPAGSDKGCGFLNAALMRLRGLINGKDSLAARAQRFDRGEE